MSWAVVQLMSSSKILRSSFTLVWKAAVLLSNSLARRDRKRLPSVTG